MHCPEPAIPVKFASAFVFFSEADTSQLLSLPLILYNCTYL